MSQYLKAAIAALALALPLVSWAQGKIAVVDLQAAILQTDIAQKRLAEVRDQDDYKSNKKEFDRIKKEFDELVTKFQKDAAVMSQDQQLASRTKLANKQADLEHVTKKLQQAEQAAGQALLQELSPVVQEVLRDLIKTEGIGLLMPRATVIHADPGFSITAKVTDKLNQKAPE